MWDMKKVEGGLPMLSVNTLILIVSCLFALFVLYEILPPWGVKQIDVIQLMKMLEEESREDYQYIDVRPAEQFNTLHVFGFQNIPLKQLKNDLKNLSKDKSVVVISERGNNSNEACRVLKRHGFLDLINVRGGIITWEKHRNTF